MTKLKRVLSTFLAALLLFSFVSVEIAGSAASLNASPNAVYSYSINYYIKDTVTPIIASLTGSVTVSGYVLAAVAVTIPGYFLDPFEQSPKSVPLTQPFTNVNFYYTARTYTVTFESQGGTAVNPISQSYKTLIAKPANPTKENCVFRGWFYDEACTQLVSWPLIMPLYGATLYAGWQWSPVTLAFNANGGSAVSPVTAVPATIITKPSDPARNLYRFDGWFFDTSFLQPVSWPLSMPYGNSTVYAKWTFVYSTMIFVTNGGSAVSSITASPNTNIYPPSSPTKAGYDFSGWYYDNWTFLNPVQWPVKMREAGFTFYAKWLPQSITISFDSSGGTAVQPLVALAGSPVSAPESPKKFGYTFTGWSLNNQTYEFSTMPDHNITLVAKWNTSPRSAEAKLETYKTVGGNLVPVSSARVGDIVTVVFSVKTNFYCGSTRFVIMYDSDFYQIIGSNKGAVHPNTENSYYADAISNYAGATTSPSSAWPSTFTGGESSMYMFAAANFGASSASVNGGHPVIIGDETSLFSIDLLVKEGAAGSGRIFMDRRWDRSSTYSTGGQYYFYCANGTVLSSSGLSILDFDTSYDNADRTLTLDTSVPPVVSAKAGATTVISQSNGFIFGLETGLTQAAFENNYVHVTGNGRLVYTPSPGGFGTGTKVELVENGTDIILAVYYIVLFGDVNGDANIDGNDAGILAEYENYNIPWDQPEDSCYIFAGDIDKNGNIDSNDAGRIIEVENYNMTVNQSTGLAS